MGIEGCVDVSCNFTWSFLLEAGPSGNLHLQSTTFTVLRLTANGEPWMPFGNHCRSDSQRTGCNTLTRTTQSERIPWFGLFEKVRFVLFSFVYTEICISDIILNLSHKTYLQKPYWSLFNLLSYMFVDEIETIFNNKIHLL